MNSNTKSLLILLGTLFVLVVLGIGVLAVVGVKKMQETRHMEDVSHAFMLAECIMMYSADHEGKLPGATWRKDIAPYLGAGRSADGFALNRAVADKHMSKLNGQTVLLFESAPGVEIGGVGDLSTESRFSRGYIYTNLDGSVQSSLYPKTFNWSGSYSL